MSRAPVVHTIVTAIRIVAVLMYSLVMVCAPVGSAAAESSAARFAGSAWTRGVRDASAGLPGRWERELARRRALARAHPGRDPAAVLALAGLLGELDDDVRADALVGFVESIASDRSRHSLVRAYARYLRASLYESAGDVNAAKQVFSRDGQLISWLVIGPFDNAERKGDGIAYAPEREAFAPHQQFFGTVAGEPLEWRAHVYGSATRGGFVSLDNLLRPNDHVLGYATTWVHIDHDQMAVLHLGTGGAYKAWINGELVGSQNSYRQPHPLQEAHSIRLRRGWNRVLIKISVEEGTWGFYARISDPRGDAIAQLRGSGDPPSDAEAWAWGAPTTAASIAGAASSLRSVLEQRAARANARVTHELDLLEFYRWTHPFGPDEQQASDQARSVSVAHKSARSAWLWYLLERDEAQTRNALMVGIARARSEGKSASTLLARMLLELSRRERALGLELRGRMLLDEAQRIAPDDVIVELARIERVSEDGFELAALAWSEELAKRYPESLTVQRDLATRLLSLGRKRDVLTLLERLSKEHPGEASIVQERVDLHLEIGEVERAVELARARTWMAPELASAHARLAHLEQARGDLTSARSALGRALALLPQDADLHAELGRLQVRSGDRPSAATSLRRSLALRPQQPELRDLASTLQDERMDDIFTRHAIDLRSAARHASPASWHGKPSGVLHERIAVRVLDNGLSERLEHRIIRVLDDRGIVGEAMQSLGYDPEESTVEVRRARVLRRDGSLEDIGETRIHALAEAGFRMYYNQRVVQVHFAGLRVGDVLEVAFVRRDIAARNKFDEYFGDLVPVQGFEPRLRTEYLLEAPATRKLHFNVPVQRTLSIDGKRVLYRYAAKDVVGIKPEANMPGWTEIARYLHVSSYESWDAVARWYWSLVHEQLVVDANIRKGVRDAIASLPANADERAKLDAIYRHVIRSTRYVGLEFGIHGYKPYRTTDVYQRRFGDCKDKASLLKVMLAEVDITSHLVLVRTRDQGSVGTVPASLAAFNHAIVYVPKFELYLDGTAEWSGPNELPPGDQDAMGLIVRDGAGAELRRLPVSRSEDNRHVSKQHVRISETGSATMVHETHVTGAGASDLRRSLQAEQQRHEQLTKTWGRLFPGTTIESVQVPGIDDVLQPVTIDAKVQVPSFASAERGRLRFRTLGHGSGLVQRYTPQSKRQHELVLDVPLTEEQEIHYTLAKGLNFTHVPESRDIGTSTGRFRLEVTRNGNAAHVRAKLEFSKHRIATNEYESFREFLRQVDAGLEQAFEVELAR